MKKLALIALLLPLTATAKTFQNSYVSFEMPDTWACLQEGVAWTCTSSNVIEAKEAVIVLAAKVAGPEDNLTNFLNHLKQPKKITTKVGTPMPSQVMYAQKREVSGMEWVQSQHVSSEIPDYYTLYLATVKDKLAILISFSAERTKIGKYNPIFDGAIKSLKIIADQKLLFPKTPEMSVGAGAIGLQPSPQALDSADALLTMPEAKKTPKIAYLIGVLVLAAVGGFVAFRMRGRKKK